jgi:hypothetical protein
VRNLLFPGVAPLQIAGAIALQAMSQNQILGARIGSACTNLIRCRARFSVVGGNRLRATA